MLGLIAGGRDGFSATLFYTTVYGITLLGAFGVCGAVRQQTGGDDLQNFSDLRTRSPTLAACMAIFMLSLAGLPPLAGFFGKFFLFSAAFRAGPNHGLLWLVILALFGSLISLYYYLIVLKAIFVDRQSQPLNLSTTRVRLGPQPFLQSFTVTVLAAAVLLLGIIPQTLVGPIVRALPWDLRDCEAPSSVFHSVPPMAAMNSTESAPDTRRFCLILIKPSHYDDDGYVIQWLRSTIPSNSLAALYGLARDCAERHVLGDDVEIEIHPFDETNTRIRPERFARMIERAGAGMVMLVGVQSNQFPRALDLARSVSRFTAFKSPSAVSMFRAR